MSIIDIVNELNNSTILKNIEIYTVHLKKILRCTDCIVAALSYVRTITINA